MTTIHHPLNTEQQAHLLSRLVADADGGISSFYN